MADLAASDVTITVENRLRFNKQRRNRCKIEFGDGALTYPSGGVPLPTYEEWGLVRNIDFLNVTDPNDGTGIIWKYDQANHKLRGYEGAPSGTITLDAGASNVTVTDDDNASTTGVAVYLHIDEVLEQGSFLGHLEFVSPTDADTYFAINNGGPVVKVQDDDNAATGGLAVYFDEDGANADERFLVDLDTPGDSDVFIMCSNGEMIRIKDDDSASSNGVQVYIDEDASNDYEKLLFVSPTDTDGTGATDDTVSMNAGTATFAGSDAAFSELDAGSDAPAAQTLYAEAVGW